MSQTTRENRLNQALSDALSPIFFELENESNRHQRPGNDTHFKAIIVSDKFNPLSRINRHRLVNDLCADEFKTGLHALSLHLYTPTEWHAREQNKPNSPPCNSAKR